jgi:carbonic anhydrase
MNIESVEEKLQMWKRPKFNFPYKELTGKPKWRTLILTCMDCRIISSVFGIEDPGEVTIIRNAGALFTPDSLRSILIAVYELNVNKIIVVGHSKCGGQMTPQRMNGVISNIAQKNSIEPDEVLRLLKVNSPDKALSGFVDVHQQMEKTVSEIEQHPLLHSLDIHVSGFIYDTETGTSKKIA